MSWITEVGPYVLGVGGLAFGWKQSTRSLDHDRTLADLAAVRDVLEKGAVHLHRLAYELDDVKTNIVGNAQKVHDALDESGKKYDELVERLKVRLGPDRAVTKAFVSANENVLTIYKALGLILLQSKSDNPVAQKFVADLVDRKRTEIESAREEFDGNRENFIRLAAKTAGAKLPS